MKFSALYTFVSLFMGTTSASLETGFLRGIQIPVAKKAKDISGEVKIEIDHVDADHIDEECAAVLNDAFVKAYEQVYGVTKGLEVEQEGPIVMNGEEDGVSLTKTNAAVPNLKFVFWWVSQAWLL
jgi:hypothetical protein